MQRNLPRALVACILEGRDPHPCEVDGVAAQVWRESYARVPASISPPRGGSADYSRALAIARASFGLSIAA